MFDNRDSIDFAVEPVDALFRKMLLPTLVGMISIVLLNFADGAFVGHGAGSESLAAINIAAPIFNIMAGIGIMFGIGCSVVSSIHLSRGEVKAANINVTQALVGSVGLSVLVSVAILSNLDGTCRLFGSSEALIPLASGYLRWIALAEPLIMFHMVGSFLVRLDGQPNFAMATSVGGSFLNIFLDWLFIFPMGWGLEGAAIATAVSFSLSGIAVILYFVFFARTLHLHRLRLSIKSLAFSLRNVGYQIRLGFSAMLGEVAISGAMIIGNYVFIDRLGEDGVAAYSVACYCFPIIFMMANAIVQSAQPIVSFAFGANNVNRLNEAFRLVMRWASLAGFALAALFLFGANCVTSLFLDSGQDAFDISVHGLPFFGLGVIFVTINVVYIGFLQSVGQSVRASFYTILRGFVFVIPIFLFLPGLVGNVGLWLSIPLAECLTSLVMLLSRKL